MFYKINLLFYQKLVIHQEIRQKLSRTSAKKNHRYKNILHLVSFRWKKSCLNNILGLIYLSVNIYQTFFLHAAL